MIPRHFETEAEYREHRALSSTNLASYWHGGMYSPDHALQKFEYKSYFEYGKMFETLLQDTVKGTHDFLDRFFISGVQGSRPDNLIKWIEDGEDLTKRIVYNKDGVTRSGTKKTLHAYIDECMDNPGLIPVSKEEYDMLMMHVDRMCVMPYLDVPCGDLLAKAEWQVGIKWTDDFGLRKKALLDAIVDLGGEYLTIDIKTNQDERNFGYMLKDKYWIQDCHYIEGVNAEIGASMQMLFLVAYKTAPHLCQPVSVDYGDVDWRINAMTEYQELCQSYLTWLNDGRQSRGWLPMRTHKLWLGR
jgi:hypothetical protein